MSTPALDFQQVGIRRGDRPILSEVNLTLPAGGWLNIIGPNGQGKSTLLHTIAGLNPWKPEGDNARAEVFGQPVSSHRSTMAKLVCLCPQRPTVPEGMKVRRYVELGRLPHQGLLGRSDAEDERVIDEVMQRLDVSGFAERYLTELSGGELHRVVLAKALAQQPRMLLLDEPTAALDIGRAQEFLEIVDSLRISTGLTVVMTVHDLTLAASYGDHLAALSGGLVYRSGSAAEVITPEMIAEVYNATVTVIDGPHGPVVLPLRRAMSGRR
ncbi:putative siderophore transport system ATP-binding protein YusV [Corynebacterium ciconiae DSM 44920]|uniref:ABC transporter ATP-binding protein n=1 Tax=Corynebacterium ciconiae TaxID=227319 RepID=UPI00035D500D|nr:ABC transporter ATP-binding protein [Corynebacterium ciconiae]WKD61277.1 putative siderophore transport system ATP-binding protein YusV [Corynebacterium ciconiae DSM 44920]